MSFCKEITFVETDTDRYGRTIAKVYYDNNRYLSEELIKAGFAWWYHYFSDNKELGKLQEVAKTKKLGLWSDLNAISPWEFRKK
nr:thermonuclease family protein [Chryseobacterium echinoideorum]